MSKTIIKIFFAREIAYLDAGCGKMSKPEKAEYVARRGQCGRIRNSEIAA
jgi:hypothetical protein